MRVSSRLRGVVLVVMLAGWASAVQATPIQFTTSAVASGAIGGTSFTNAAVTLTGTGNTSTVVPVTACDGSTCITLDADVLSTTVTIAGIGTALITDPTGIWAFGAAIPGFSPAPLVIFGRIDTPPALDSFTGIGVTAADALAGYGLTTAIGPVTGVGGIGFPPCGIPGRDACLATTLGALSFAANASLHGTSTFTATLAPVPEPTSLLLFGSGIVALVARRSRLRQRR